ncbi:hypothetical protein C0431_13220 [bacterium]|nr:hypothetical protein [bacterium]
MTQDVTMFNPKGRVKIELYNEEGVFKTLEKKNLVVRNANKIVANMLATPGKKTRYPVTENGAASISAGADGLYPYKLQKSRYKEVAFSVDPGASNTDTIIVIGKRVDQIKQVRVGGVVSTLFTDYRLVDKAEGKIEFVVAPKAPVEIDLIEDVNPTFDIVAGAQKVYVAGELWKEGATAVDTAKRYIFDAKLGVVKFQSTKIDVRVEYEVELPYGLAFMALGGKPSGHPDFQPVAFSKLDKLKENMPEEIAKTRVAINFPAEISNGVPEIEVLNTIAPSVEKLTQKVTVIDDGAGAANLTATLGLVSSYGPRTFFRLVKAVRKSDSKDFVAAGHVAVTDAATGKIAFTSGQVVIADEIDVEYELLLSNQHLRYNLSEAPAIQIARVKHVHAVTGEVTDYVIADSGLTIGSGDVWFSNPNAGQIEFKAQPTGQSSVKNPVYTPGQITVEYYVNAGTTVKFVADFPKEIPDITLADETKTQTLSGATTITLLRPIAKNQSGAFLVKEVRLNNVLQTEAVGYEVGVDGLSVTFLTATGNENVLVVYQYEKTSFDVYQVAMFDGMGIDAKMFNIAGIGPVTKDRTTGMRVTWSVTF